ncbi:hypothetical protein [Plantactinospora sp. KLBMP9567]|uniref:hypothetical protein n=1 Tax=Plantactinospora sp. KLBMP9567 TaxID=3085900 RepID=UPI0029822E1B|nr:hypothetical protein [Plantactinospora sp. KLBMP9567]MDW5327965.1 hypothetical protein [Plantactinospora sp. KLBMP9567]
MKISPTSPTSIATTRVTVSDRQSWARMAAVINVILATGGSPGGPLDPPTSRMQLFEMGRT